MEKALSGIVGHRRDLGAHHRGQGATSPSGSCSSATSTTPPTTSARRSPARSQSVPPELLPPVITKVDPDADPVMSLIVSSEGDEPADADRDRRQAGQARASRRSTASAQVDASAAAAPREIHIVVDIEKLNALRPVDRPGARRDRQRRTSRFPAARSSRARGSCCCARSAASTRPTVQQHRRRDRRTARRSACPTSATPRTRSERPTIGGRGWATRRRCMLDIRRAMGENTVAVIEGVQAKLAGDPADAAARRSR